MIHATGHPAVANSLALEAVRCTEDAPAPNGGVIRRRPGGEPNVTVEERRGLPHLKPIKPHPDDEG